MVTAAGPRVATQPALDLDAARTALADEWRAANPQTPEEIARFYRETPNYGPDLDAWHQTTERQHVTESIVHVAREANVTCVVDIGCGAGHDLAALDHIDSGVHAALHGVEPNEQLRAWVNCWATCTPTIADAPIESADLLICIDVLEHLPDPEVFLTGIATRARLGCLLFEMTATHDISTPLHLVANRGWQPGRCLERHGWECVDYSGRVRVWRRTAEQGEQRASLLLCAYRSVAVEHLTALLALCAGEGNWRLSTKSGDALISRSRAIVVTKWWRETADDVFLMVDDDIAFTPDDADRLVALCRAGHDVVCGAYPVHDGGHLACRFLPGTADVHFGPEQPPTEIAYAATGFMAVHRRVIDAMVATVPLCHADQTWSFYPLFQPLLQEHPTAGHEWLSEDWGFCQTARDLGFRIWLDPRTRLKHLGSAAVSLHNMVAMHQALIRA